MGVKGLLPFLKKCTRPIKIKTFRGYTVAIDAYCWIHRAAYSCAMDLGLGNSTNSYVKYCMKFLQMIISAQLKPILVFDGANLPAKADTEIRRRKSKMEYKEKAAQYLREGNRRAAQECFERCVEVTPEMARAVMKAARRRGVDCIVAPYEADAQLAYLAQAGYVDLIITEDSDLLMFGCKQVIFKLDLMGNGLLVTWSAGFGEQCCGIPPSNFSPATLRQMGVLAGCDYFPGVPRIGLATAAKILRQYHPPDFRTLLSNLGNYFNLPEIKSWPLTNDEAPEESSSQRSETGEDEDTAFALDASFTISASSTVARRGRGRGGCSSSLTATRRVSAVARRNLSCSVPNRLPEAMITAAVRAERTFRLQVVFDPKTRRRIRLTQPTPTDVGDERLLLEEDDNPNKSTSLFYYAGDDSLDPEIAFQMAVGNLDFYTGETVGNFDVDKFRVIDILCPGWPVLSEEDFEIIKNDPKITIQETSAESKFCWPEDSPYFEHPPTFSLDFGYAGSAFKVRAIPRPDRSRCALSIWSARYDLQPVWLFYLHWESTRPRFFCISVSSPDSVPGLPCSNPNTPLTIRPRTFSSSSSLSSSSSPGPLLPSRPSLPRLKTSAAYTNHRVFFPVIAPPKPSVPVKRPLSDEEKQADEDSRLLTESAKISKVLESYGQATQPVSPMASHGTSETPVVSASAYFKSPLSAVCKAAPPSPPHSPVFAPKSANSLKRSTLNRFAVVNTSPSFLSADPGMDQALHSLDNGVKPRVMQTSPFRPPLAELPLVNHAPEAAPTSTGLGSIGVPQKIEQTTNLFAAAISPPGARPRPCSPVYSGGDTILGDGGVQIFKAEESHSSSVDADGCSVQKNLVSVNFSKWRFKSSRSSL